MNFFLVFKAKKTIMKIKISEANLSINIKFVVEIKKRIKKILLLIVSNSVNSFVKQQKQIV